MPDDVLIVLTTHPEREGAERLAEKLVQKKLAACVNIHGRMTSIYPWKGRIERGEEHQMVIKTSTRRYVELEAVIRREHPYELPEILTLPVTGGLIEYLDWIQTCTD